MPQNAAERKNLKFRFYKEEFAVCRIPDLSKTDLLNPSNSGLCFLAKTPDELSLVCPSGNVPANAEKTESGWSLFRIEGELDFSLVGILAKISALLAENGISIFAVSTFNTDYILVKAEKKEEARTILEKNGYAITPPAIS